MPFYHLLLSLLSLTSLTSCLAIIDPRMSLGNSTQQEFSSSSESEELLKRADKPFYLRIAPLGASITNGYLSTDNNGYRKYLRDQLRFVGWPVNMVGSLNTGTMKDNGNEGHIGWTIKDVTDKLFPIL